MPVTVVISGIGQEAHDAALREGLLVPAERAAADRCRCSQARQRHVIARALLRRALAARLGRDAATLEFVTNAHGKPALAEDLGLHFNLTHSGERVAVGLSEHAPIGVDIEHRERRNRIDALARHYFSTDEQAWLNAVATAERRYRFFQLWTLKEAVTKSLGRSLWETLDGVHLVDLDAAEPRLILDRGATCPDPMAWGHYDLGEGYSLCLAHRTDTAGPARVLAAQSVADTEWPHQLDLAGVRP